MAFTIPNESDATYGDQAEPDSVDFRLLADALAGWGIVSGGAVTAQGTPDGTVAVASGVARTGGSNDTISAGNVSVISGAANADGSTATAADATLARFSLITCTTAATLGVVHGTAAANPVFPTGPIGTKSVLAAIFVPAAATTVTSAQIVDKRVIMNVDALHDAAHALSGANHSGAISVAQGLGKSQQLTGAAQATNYVGATTTGLAPGSGTFAVGDFLVGHIGNILVCTTAGSPGTWATVGGGSFLSSEKWS